jgi:hypothetical protein
MLFKVLKTIVRGDGGDEAEEVGLELAALPTGPADIAGAFPFGSTVSVVLVRGDDEIHGEDAIEAEEHPITPEDARTLLRCVTAGTEADVAPMEAVQPKLEAIAGESWR